MFFRNYSWYFRFNSSKILFSVVRVFVSQFIRADVVHVDVKFEILFFTAGGIHTRLADFFLCSMQATSKTLNNPFLDV